jgi:hypothetical protein
MAQNFSACDRDQELLLPPSLREWLPENHLAEVNVDSPDFGHLEPMVAAARDELARAGVATLPEVVLADAGYWHQVQMERLVSEGIAVLIPPDAKKRAGARPGWNGGLYVFMRGVLATDHGRTLYAKRETMVEPVFADTMFNRRIDRFQRRGRAAARSEWRLATAAHNLLKLWRHTTMRRAGFRGHRDCWFLDFDGGGGCLVPRSV